MTAQAAQAAPRRRTFGAAIWRGLILVHRYLGVAVGVVMTLWCLSGFVMMYSGYPRLVEAERVRALRPLRFDGCCADPRPALAAAGELSSFRVEMLDGRPTLRLARADGEQRLLDLRSGSVRPGVERPEAVRIAAAFAAARGVQAPVVEARLIDFDQWTVQSARRRGPVYRVAFADPARTTVYVGRRSGEVAQVTTARGRFWGWLGAVPHWLYPTILRQDGELWSQVVIWTSLAGTFLTATGLWIGVARVKRYRNGRWSPYRGLFHWHHVTGLVFGVLTLTWVATGLLTMNPWGALDSTPGLTERRRLAGRIDPAEVAHALAVLPSSSAAGALALRSAPLDGRLFVVVIDDRGRKVRFDALGAPAPLPPSVLQALVKARLGAAAPLRLVTQPDAYNYPSQDRPADLPAYRLDLRDASHTTLYLDPVTGEVLRGVDDTQRLSRWTRTGLHDWDFAILRRRPVWDLVVLFMLTGVTAVCALGAWMGVRRTRRDLG